MLTENIDYETMIVQYIMLVQKNDLRMIVTSPKHNQHDSSLYLATRLPKKVLEVDIDGRATNGDKAT